MATRKINNKVAFVVANFFSSRQLQGISTTEIDNMKTNTQCFFLRVQCNFFSLIYDALNAVKCFRFQTFLLYFL